jgi:hypothetical protein
LFSINCIIFLAGTVIIATESQDIETVETLFSLSEGTSGESEFICTEVLVCGEVSFEVDVTVVDAV